MVYNFVLKADSLSLYFTKKIVISNIAEQKIFNKNSQYCNQVLYKDKLTLNYISSFIIVLFYIIIFYRSEAFSVNYVSL